MEKYTFQDFMNMFLHNEVPLETIDIITEGLVMCRNGDNVIVTKDSHLITKPHTKTVIEYTIGKSDEDEIETWKSK